jgi:molybdate transport system substrate-binding protein
MNPPLKLITSMASRELLKALCVRYQQQSQQEVIVEAAGGVDVAKRLRAGEPVDVAVLSRHSIDDLARERFLVADSITDIANSGIAVAVATGAPAPDISSEQALRRAVLAASTVSYSTGPSGVYLEKRFAAWEVLDQIRPRIVVPPPGVPVGSLVASGRVALGFQQLSELINVEGITVLGPLPAPLQLLTTFSGAIAQICGNAHAARELLRFLAAPELADVKVKFGMQHC